MTRLLVSLAFLAGLLSAAALDAQANRKDEDGKPGPVVLDQGQAYRNEKYGIQFKVPRQFRLAKNARLRPDIDALFAVPGRPWEVTLGEIQGARELEQVRENIISSLQKSQPSATTRILRGGTVGGMKKLTIVIGNLPGSRGSMCQIFNAVDAPLRGLIKFVLMGPQSEEEELVRVSEWIMPWFRLSGQDGEDILFQRRTYDAESALSYRLLDGSKPKPEPAEGGICEGETQNGVWYRIEKITDAPAGKLDAVIENWVKGAKSIVAPYETPSGHEDRNAMVGMFDAYGGRPARAVLAFRPNDENLYRLETSGGAFPLPLVVAEELASVMQWIDRAALEAEMQSWMAKLDDAIRKKDESQIERIARRVARSYYLATSLEIARKILRVGEEKAQVYALKCIEQGGNIDADFNDLKRAVSDSKFKDRTKMRVAAVEAMGALVNTKSTDYLLRLARSEKDDMVAKAAALALGRHVPNRKLVLPNLVSLYGQVLKDRTSRNDSKKLRASRLGDAYRSALRSLTGQDFTDPKAARAWLDENRKVLNAEEVIK